MGKGQFDIGPMSEKNEHVSRTITALRRSNGMAGSESVRYVALGDSVTAGWLEHGILDSEAAYPTLFRRRLASLYPHAVISVINAGLGGENASGALGRLDRDVIRHDPHLVTICLGLNDARSGVAGLEEYRQSLTAIIERLQSESSADIILITPNTRGDAIQEDGTMTEYVRVIRAVARAKSVGLADVHAIYQGALRSGIKDPADLLSNRISHPTREGHHNFANALIAFFQPS
jgi:acyl-CoA thioesterase-1